MNEEQQMLAFAKLAEISHSKGQLLPRDKFLVLTGMAACRAGWLKVAERCRELVLAHNPSHLLQRFATISDALRADDFDAYRKQLLKFCTYERAEHLLTQSENMPQALDSTAGTGERTLAILNAPGWLISRDGQEAAASD